MDTCSQLPPGNFKGAVVTCYIALSYDVHMKTAQYADHLGNSMSTFPGGGGLKNSVNK